MATPEMALPTVAASELSNAGMMSLQINLHAHNIF